MLLPRYIEHVIFVLTRLLCELTVWLTVGLFVAAAALSHAWTFKLAFAAAVFCASATFYNAQFSST